MGRGCSRDHACSPITVTRDWTYVASLYAEAAAAARAVPGATTWDHRRTAMHERRAAQAAWLAGQPRAARDLALRAWEDNRRLEVADVATITAAVLADPGT